MLVGIATPSICLSYIYASKSYVNATASALNVNAGAMERTKIFSSLYIHNLISNAHFRVHFNVKKYVNAFILSVKIFLTIFNIDGDRE